MIKKILLVASALCLWSGVVGASTKPMNHRFGLGFALGAPTAIVGKYYQDPSHAIDMGLGYWFADYLDIYVDYLWHWPKAFASAQDPFPQFVPYVGVGGELHIAARPLNTYDNNHPSIGIGVRVPVGVEWLPKTAPLGVFLEIVPGIQFVPGVVGFLGAAIGIRFYF